MLLYFLFLKFYNFLCEALFIAEGHKVLDGEVENLYSTEDGETSEEAHCSSNDGYLSFQRVFRVFLNEVERGCVEIHVNHFQLVNIGKLFS